MERWRWLPRDLGNPHVIVNVPDYSLSLYNNGKVFWHTKIVAGKPAKATPMVSRRDEVHHRQPDLERAAVDHRE